MKLVSRFKCFKRPVTTVDENDEAYDEISEQFHTAYTIGKVYGFTATEEEGCDFETIDDTGLRHYMSLDYMIQFFTSEGVEDEHT